MRFDWQRRMRRLDEQPNGAVRAASARFRGIFREYISYPTAPGAIEDGFAFAVLECRAEAKRKKLLDDLSLRRFRCFHASSAAACVLHRQVKRGGPGFIFQCGITASFEQAFHRGGRSRADGAMQRRGAIFVLGIYVGSGVEQALDCLHLSFLIPVGAGYVAIRRIVQWAALTMIFHRVWVGSRGQE